MTGEILQQFNAPAWAFFEWQMHATREKYAIWCRQSTRVVISDSIN